MEFCKIFEMYRSYDLETNVYSMLPNRRVDLNKHVGCTISNVGGNIKKIHFRCCNLMIFLDG